jgi:hypothetical protein
MLLQGKKKKKKAMLQVTSSEHFPLSSASITKGQARMKACLT